MPTALPRRRVSARPSHSKSSTPSVPRLTLVWKRSWHLSSSTCTTLRARHSSPAMSGCLLLRWSTGLGKWATTREMRDNWCAMLLVSRGNSLVTNFNSITNSSQSCWWYYTSSSRQERRGRNWDCYLGSFLATWHPYSWEWHHNYFRHSQRRCCRLSLRYRDISGYWKAYPQCLCRGLASIHQR